MKKQIQITQIENGWLVAHPDYASISKMVMHPNSPNQQQPQGVAMFCEDYEAVSEYLKTIMVIE